MFVPSGMLRRVALVRTDVPPKRRFIQDPHGATSHKTSFLVVTAVKATHLTNKNTQTSKLRGF
jgi:hypothetical protein